MTKNLVLPILITLFLLPRAAWPSGETTTKVFTLSVTIPQHVMTPAKSNLTGSAALETSNNPMQMVQTERRIVDHEAVTINSFVTL